MRTSETIDWRHKAFPEPADAGEIAARRWNVLRGDLVFPVLLLRESALANNITAMAAYCRQHGLSLAPHAKTTMSPQIFLREIEAGAWGLTAQVPAQARIYRHFGVRRVLIANEVVQPAALRWIASELDADPECEIYVLVDSVDGVSLMDAGLGPRARRLPVLVELGVAGGRTGARTDAQADDVARAVAASASLELAGVEAFDGFLHSQGRPIADVLGDVDALVGRVQQRTRAFDGAGLFAGRSEIVVSIGSSAFFDRTAALGAGWGLGRPVRVVVRAGAYVTHDSWYDDVSPLDGRRTGQPRLRGALEAWGQVLSVPEAGLGIVGFGKRDVPYDVSLPAPFEVRSRSGRARPAAGLQLSQVMDHHAFVRFEEGAALRVGELVGCRVAHSCTAFDKWRAIPVVDDDYNVVDAVQTYF